MKRKGLLLLILMMCFMTTNVYSYAEEATAPTDNQALVELYYSELAKQADKSLLNQASSESSQLALYYSELAKQDIALSNVYSQLAEYYNAVANTNCICMINGTFQATGVCTCGKNPNPSTKANGKNNSGSSKKSSTPKKTYAYDDYGYLVDGSVFFIKGKCYIKSGKYFVDLDGYHYSIDEDDIVYGIEKIEKETGKVYRIEAIEFSQAKHNAAVRDTKDYRLWTELNK